MDMTGIWFSRWLEWDLGSILLLMIREEQVLHRVTRNRGTKWPWLMRPVDVVSIDARNKQCYEDISKKCCSDTCPVTGSYHHCRSSVDRRDKLNVHLIRGSEGYGSRLTKYFITLTVVVDDPMQLISCCCILASWNKAMYVWIRHDSSRRRRSLDICLSLIKSYHHFGEGERRWAYRLEGDKH